MSTQVKSSPAIGQRSVMKRLKLYAKQVIALPLRLLNSGAELYCWTLSKIRTHFGYLWSDLQFQKISRRLREIEHISGGEIYCLKFYTPNYLCEIRAATFSSKEPGTLAWIDQYGGQGVFFDIGANVGLYSIYYGKTKLGNVYAFEPSVFNLPLLVKNLSANELEKRIKIISTPLTDKNQFSSFTLSSTQEGGALSSFGVDYGYDGKILDCVCSYQTLGQTLDFLFDSGLLAEYPTMIKIDVDGTEPLILRGAIKTLSNPVCKTVLVEVLHDFRSGESEVSLILSRCGFSLIEELDFSQPASEDGRGSANQIWLKR